MVLIRHFAKEFDEKHMAGKGSVLDHPKAVAKLRKQVQHAQAQGHVKHALLEIADNRSTRVDCAPGRCECKDVLPCRTGKAGEAGAERKLRGAAVCGGAAQRRGLPLPHHAVCTALSLPHRARCVPCKCSAWRAALMSSE
jgi:hypothetical protein